MLENFDWANSMWRILTKAWCGAIYVLKTNSQLRNGRNWFSNSYGVVSRFPVLIRWMTFAYLSLALIMLYTL